jgi:hypothetical protein
LEGGRAHTATQGREKKSEIKAQPQNHQKEPTTTKVDMPNSQIAIFSTHVFEWYVVRCGSKNRHQKDMFSIANIIGGDLCDH